ncbi:TPA: YopX family protein [Streptococcus suis]
MILKFRFWDREKGCFVDDSLYLDSLGNVYRDVTVDFFGPEAIENPIRPLECIEVMQSTGLFDKNGKEIFEGDVVSMHSGELLPVRLHHGMFEPVCYYASSVLEKVGNIFENPELTEHPDFREATDD